MKLEIAAWIFLASLNSQAQQSIPNPVEDISVPSAEGDLSHESAVAHVTVPTAARILGNIPDGTPPPPEAPKPPFVVAQKDILSSVSHQQGGRTITIQRIKPIALPPPPPPPVVSLTAAADNANYRQQLDEYREQYPSRELIFLSATVFRAKDAPPRTLVRIWSEGRGEDVTLWSSADFALIAGGINSFVGTEGLTHYLIMGWGNQDIDSITDLKGAIGRQYGATDLPAFPAGKASYSIVGKQPAAEDLVIIQSLHDLYNNEHAHLLTAYQGRERARIVHEAELKAHPPQPENITLNFWRTDRPGPEKGGSK